VCHIVYQKGRWISFWKFIRFLVWNKTDSISFINFLGLHVWFCSIQHYITLLRKLCNGTNKTIKSVTSMVIVQNIYDTYPTSWVYLLKNPWVTLIIVVPKTTAKNYSICEFQESFIAFWHWKIHFVIPASRNQVQTKVFT
jgi:ABC-type iron transport system FetAB permease component